MITINDLTQWVRGSYVQGLVKHSDLKKWAAKFHVSSYEDLVSELHLIYLEVIKGELKLSFDIFNLKNLGAIHTVLVRRLDEGQISVGEQYDSYYSGGNTHDSIASENDFTFTSDDTFVEVKATTLRVVSRHKMIEESYVENELALFDSELEEASFQLNVIATASLDEMYTTFGTTKRASNELKAKMIDDFLVREALKKGYTMGQYQSLRAKFFS